MDIQDILKRVDAFLEQNRGEEAEQLMLESLTQAVSEQDDNVLLQLLNELLSYYRETSRVQDADRIAQQAIAQAERMGLQGTIPYATTLLNVANAYRAGGRLKESMEYYLKVQDLYGMLFETDNMLVASLQNNFSLLYQEMGDYEKARECLLKALEISKANDAAYEVGVTNANLAATCVQLGRQEEAREYAQNAVQLFQELGVQDSHYAAALASLGAYYFQNKEFQSALEYYRRAGEIVESALGQNEAFRRLREHVAACEQALAGVPGQGHAQSEASGQSRTQSEASEQSQARAGASEGSAEKSAGTGLALCRAYYETYGAPMIREKFGAYQHRIAVGMVGRGSDCFGYDDEASRDHDWGPNFCLWVSDETYEEIGEALEQAYLSLPGEFKGYHRAPEVNGKGRRGVWRISDFYRSLVGADRYEAIDWRQVSDHGLAAAVNGEVFRDEEGIFTEFRRKLEEGYPLEIRYLKLAEAAAGFSQAAQYNFPRMLKRGDTLTAGMMVWDGIKAAMKLQHYIEGKYPPHDKWLYHSLKESQAGSEVAALVEEIVRSMGAVESISAEQAITEQAVMQQPTAGRPVIMQSFTQPAAIQAIEKLGTHLAMEMYGRDFISDIEPYLDAHSQELVYKASLAAKSREELAEEIARLEFDAFDKVKNEGGRASCQNDWPTFSIMRKSQYLTWDRIMLLQYLYDFRREYSRGHNLIEEKYGRMMESTAPERYEELKTHFPELTPEKKAIIEQICGIQVGWMEEFAGEYPALADNARSIHSYEDNPFDTSYETYLRGELGTYSDKMLELYGRYIVEYARAEKNLASDIMGNSVRMYGYESIEEAERKTAAAWQ
ncbi:MAG: DUF4125 family protein [Acetatifactor sp.]|nr:DUF4125 family protein [Acetatifactor sp.]